MGAMRATLAMTMLACCMQRIAALSLMSPIAHRSPVPVADCQRTGKLVMGRKGRPKMPNGGMQGGMNQAGGAPAQAPADGTPLFYLYCRTGAGKPWYPVSAMKGDGQSKGLVDAWLGSPVAKGVFKDRLDEGMARSIFDSERRLADMAVTQYAQLKNNKPQLQWGFKILSKDVQMKEAAGEIEKQKIVPVDKSMLTTGLVNQAQAAAKKFFGGDE